VPSTAFISLKIVAIDQVHIGNHDNQPSDKYHGNTPRRRTFMAGFGHGSTAPAEAEDPAVAARNSRYGLWLFLVYFVIYAAFVGLNAFTPDVMATRLGGVNLAVVYGMVLIVTALVLALIYCWLCRGQSTNNTTRDAVAGDKGAA
jgi:uncharacterized membrane protein (DUF485 family)